LKDQFDFVCHSLTIRRVRKKVPFVSIELPHVRLLEPYIRMGSVDGPLRTKIRAMLLEGHR
jgi:hypothetical protein